MKANGATVGDAAAAPATSATPDTDAPRVAAAQHWSAPIVARHVADDVVDRLVTAVALGLYVTGQHCPPSASLPRCSASPGPRCARP